MLPNLVIVLALAFVGLLIFRALVPKPFRAQEMLRLEIIKFAQADVSQTALEHLHGNSYRIFLSNRIRSIPDRQNVLINALRACESTLTPIEFERAAAEIQSIHDFGCGDM